MVFKLFIIFVTMLSLSLHSSKLTKVYSLTHCLTNRKVIQVQWVLKVKTLPNRSISKYKARFVESISKYKARFVEKGYTQEESIDYEHTFLLTGKPLSLC
jgi:hypothetical protein